VWLWPETAIPPSYWADDDYKGALWAFTRSNGIWSPTGSKVVASGKTGNFYEASVGISADGKTAAADAAQDLERSGAYGRHVDFRPAVIIRRH
jgi:hypothetical protein